jgi:hypothetical protein
MRRLPLIGAGIVAALVVAAGWLVAASYTALYLGRVPPNTLAQPWLAWRTYVASNPDRWTKTILLVAALLPTGTVILLVACCWQVTQRVWFHPTRQREMKAIPLYGNSHWARPGDMQSSGITRSKSAF